MIEDRVLMEESGKITVGPATRCLFINYTSIFYEIRSKENTVNVVLSRQPAILASQD